MRDDNRFYQRRTMQRIPKTFAEAEKFLWHVREHIDSNHSWLPEFIKAIEIVDKAIGSVQAKQS